MINDTILREIRKAVTEIQMKHIYAREDYDRAHLLLQKQQARLQRDNGYIIAMATDIDIMIEFLREYSTENHNWLEGIVKEESPGE